ncbi:hypothetical protein F4604DRAFT_1959269 [Suillus subluteus]|nr:hypothetical protein F4604DRAFT_1959269 [Suillus subluteus]
MSTSGLWFLYDEHPFHPCSSSHGPSRETSRRGEDDKPWLNLALILLSPPPIITRPSEKTCRSRKSLKGPLKLPSLADVGSIDFSVIIPAYNETSRLPSMLEITLNHLTSTSIRQTCTYELFIVEDGSKDDTSALALELAQQHLNSDIRASRLKRTLARAVRYAMGCYMHAETGC